MFHADFFSRRRFKQGNMDINCSLISAVREGRLERVRELISSFGLSCSPEWSGGYVLLRDAIKNKHTEVTKLLLRSDSKVNSKNQKFNTPLHLAVINGDIEIVEMLLDKGANINAENQYGRTPLHDAIENEKMEVTELLLKRGAYVNAGYNEGTSPLHVAVMRGCLQIVEHLLNHGAYVNCACTSMGREGYTPLHIATENGSEEVINLLLSSNAHINASAKYNLMPLYIATENGHEKVVKLLLDHGANVNCVRTLTWIKGYTPLHCAVEKGNEEVINLLLSRDANVDAKGKDGMTSLYIAGYLQIVQHLLRHGACVNCACTSTGRDGYTPLHIAAEKGSEEIIQFLLSNNAYINARSNYNLTPLYIATKNGHEKVVKLLLDHGASVDAQDKDGKAILHLAVKNGYLTIIEHILKYCPDVNNKDNRSSLKAAVHGYGRQYSKIVESLLQYGFSVNPEDINNCKLLHAAVEKGYLKIVEDLLKYGTDVNMLYKLTGYTPLHNATKNKQEKVATLLINYGADVNAKGEVGNTPIFYAIENTDLKITKLLLTNGANVNAEKKDGITALHIATQNGHKEVVEALLKWGAKVDSKVKRDITPLHIAAEKGYLEIVKILLKFGADNDSRDEYGRTALHIACGKKHGEIVVALLEYGSDINIITNNNRTPLDVVHDARAGIAEIIKQQIIKMKTANLYVSRKNLLSISSDDRLSENRIFQNECELEIESMKSEKINNDVSFHDILTKNISQLAIYAKNENTVQVLKSDDYKTKFPIYASMINSRFWKGVERKELLEQGNSFFHSLFNRLPEDCTEKIFIYLSDKDLRVLIDVCEHINIPNIDISNVASTSIVKGRHMQSKRKEKQEGAFGVSEGNGSDHGIKRKRYAH